MPTIIPSNDYPLHKLGWRAFQDLCVAIAEEELKRPVQTFLPTNDAGRDGAFVGHWDSKDGVGGTSTIQCKFTAQYDSNLSLSHLSDELEKASRLAQQGLATDYVIMTNHPITGQSEIKIKKAFELAGVGNCRVFHRDWIIGKIRSSARLRMLAPRLYGMGDLSELLDARAYKQAQLILSEMGDNLKKLVVTDAHRKSVRAIDQHRMVLLLGAPAAGKSTIGASLAVGAADMWQAHTLKVTSPQQLQDRISDDESQFFWVDDAWGSTQYQREKAEGWNQVFPLMQAAMMRGTRFLLTSRDYIWKRAKLELKLQSIPALQKSQVVIDVHEFTTDEKARILYNHIKLGDQSKEFRQLIKPFLPGLADLEEFLPESARRLGEAFFTSKLFIAQSSLKSFFERPEQFLIETIEQLDEHCRAAIALIFMNGGVVRSPVPFDLLQRSSDAYGAQPVKVRDELQALNGSLLLLAQDEQGPYWTYKHPTVGDAFAKYVSRDPEQIEIYLRGAKPTSIAHEVVCSGASLAGASLVVPNTLHKMLLERLLVLPNHSLVSFVSYRSNAAFSQLVLEARKEILDGMQTFNRPISDDSDAQLLATLHRQNLLSEEIRLNFVESVRRAAVEEADSSFLSDTDIKSVLKPDEIHNILAEVEKEVIENIPLHVSRLRSDWHSEYSPVDHFDSFRESLRVFGNELNKTDIEQILKAAEKEIENAVELMHELYEPPESASSAIETPKVSSGPLVDMFRDVDE